MSQGINLTMRGKLPGVFNEEQDPTHQLGYVAKRSGLFMVGKGAAEAAGEAVGHGALPGLAAGLGHSVAGVVMVGLTAGVSAMLTQMDYVHRRENIAEMYKEELAARLHKSKGKVQSVDLDTVARENRVIGEEMRQIGRQRTFGVALSFVASLAALSVVAIAMPAAAAAITGAATGALGMEAIAGTIGGAGLLIAKALTGLMAYNAVKEPLHHLADKLFDLDYTTAHDHIVNLKKERAAGRAVTREQVLSVYAAANPSLDRMIVREYGKHLEELSPDKKNVVAFEVGKFIPLEKLTNDINSGKVNVTELAFAVDGQVSGVDHSRPAEEEKKGLVQTLFEGIKRSFSAKARVEHDAAGHERISAVARMEETVMPAQEGQGNHAQRLGRESRNVEMAHVERLEQQRADQALTQQIT